MGGPEANDGYIMKLPDVKQNFWSQKFWSQETKLFGGDGIT